MKDDCRDQMIADYTAIIADNIRTVREDYRYSQKDFAVAAGVTHVQISNCEKNRCQIMISRFCRICLCYGIPFLDFLRGIDLLDFKYNDAVIPAWQMKKIFEIIDDRNGGRMLDTLPDNPKEPGALDKIIGENLRRIRDENGVSQYDLGKQIGVTPGQVCMYEQGKNRLPVAKLCYISHFLNTPLLEFLKGIDLIDYKIQRTNLDSEQAAQIIEIINQDPGNHESDIRILVLNNSSA